MTWKNIQSGFPIIYPCEVYSVKVRRDNFQLKQVADAKALQSVRTNSAINTAVTHPPINDK